MKTFLLSTFILLLSTITAHSQNIPIFQFNTEMEEGATFSIMFKCYETETILVDPGTGELVEVPAVEDINIQRSFTLGANKTIKVYGTAENLAMISVDRCKISDIDVSQLSKLKYLYIYYNDKHLNTINTSHNPELESLTLLSTSLEELDLSKNPKLTHLDLQVGNFKDLNKLVVAENNIIRLFNIGNNQLEELDLSRFPAIWQISAGNNKISKVDFSKNYDLEIIYIYKNKLSSIDLTNNTFVNYIDCVDNYFTFSTLPSPEGRNITGTNYIYLPQAVITIPEEAKEVDLSSEYEVYGETTTYKWYRETIDEEEEEEEEEVIDEEEEGEGEDEEEEEPVDPYLLIEGEDYIIKRGVTTFLKEQNSKIYCLLSNEAFPGTEEYNTLSTTLITPKAGDISAIETEESSEEVYSRSNTIYINGYAGANVQVYDIQGKLIKRTQLADEHTEININATGIYILKVQANNKVESYKVVIR